MLNILKFIVAALYPLFLISCYNSQSSNIITDEVIAQEIKSPAVYESSEPNLHTDKDGNIYLTWIGTMEDKTTTLYQSTLKDNIWSDPIKIAEGKDWFVNWADFPTLTSFGDNYLAANFLVENGEGTYAYDVNISISKDAGKSWNRPITPHSDNTPTEHGFVSLVPFQDDFMALWLDGRKYVTEEKEMTLRSAIISREGKIINEHLLDENVCSCCQTSAVSVDDAVIVVYRDRFEEEIRDISLVRFQNGSWSEPTTVSKDNWKIGGCPVNGPAIDASEQNVAIVWFTMANENPLVKMAFSDDMGSSFSTSIVVNDSIPIGRVDVVSLSDGSAFVSWIEQDQNETYIKARRIFRTGKKGETIN